MSTEISSDEFNTMDTLISVFNQMPLEGLTLKVEFYDSDSSHLGTYDTSSGIFYTP